MTKKILIIDDEPDCSELLKRRLEVLEFEVIIAYDGIDGLKKIKDSTPDLVILDLMLPGMSGEEVCRHVRKDKITEMLPIIMLTAKDKDVDRIIGKVIGADYYRVKPYDPEDLLKIIREALDRNQGGLS